MHRTLTSVHLDLQCIGHRTGKDYVAGCDIYFVPDSPKCVVFFLLQTVLASIWAEYCLFLQTLCILTAVWQALQDVTKLGDDPVTDFKEW